MEGEQCALDAQANGDQRHHHRQGQGVFPGGMELRHRFLHVAHEQVASQVVEQDNTQQEQTGTQQVHNHVPGSRHQCTTLGPGVNEGAGGNGHDFHKHVCGEGVVGVHLRHQRRGEQQDHHVIQAVLVMQYVVVQLLHATQQGQKHNQGEKQRGDAFQQAATDLVAPRRREVAHHVGVAQIRV